MNTAVTLEAEIDFETGIDTGVDTVDAIEEIRLRTWARKNYAPAAERDDGLHPIILDEMHRRDQEQ